MTKKLFVAALALPILFACGNSGNKGGGQDVPSPVYAEQAAIIEIPNASAPQVEIKFQNDALPFKVAKMEFFRSGEYLISGTVGFKSEAQLRHFSGKFTVANQVYTCTGDFDGKLTIFDEKVVFEQKGKEEQTVTNPTVTNPNNNIVPGSFEDFAYRSWTLSKIEFQIVQPVEAKVKKTFSSTNVNVTEAVALANESGVNIDPQKVEGFDVAYVSLNPSTVMVCFANGKTYSGDWKLKSDQSFSFDIAEEITSGLINNNTTTGKLDKVDGQLVAQITVNNEKLKGTMTLTLSKK